MKRRYYTKIVLAVLTLFTAFNLQAKEIGKDSYNVPLIGNAFELGYKSGTSTVGKEFATISPQTKNKTRVYFKVLGTGGLTIAVKGKSTETSKVKASFQKTDKVLLFEPTSTKVLLGEFKISTPGYYYVDLSGLSGQVDVSSLEISGSALDKGVLFCNNPEYYYWARRGPSCHLAYTVPTKSNVTYYYNEVNVPVGEDKIGSYFMANGFGQGYFGIQVNSATERRILFSVWSPFHTDDPSAIPDDEKIKLIKKGAEVRTGEFGNEGSGGQSFLRYNWKAGVTYKFLLKGEPDGKGNTVYTAWFMPESEKDWKLIASFSRPKTNTYLTGFHSFLENFMPTEGYLTRKVDFNNQWVYDGNWKSVESAKFTVDATYRAEQRVDATGGTTKTGYFLKMGGFFNAIEKPGTVFQFNNTRIAPAIDFSKLP